MPPNIAVTRIRHSCHLIEIGGKTILTDPWFTTKPHYRPGEPTAVDVAGLPDLDAVLITHEHYDHCDLDALATYRDLGVAVITPPTVQQTANDHGFRNITVLKPWQGTDVGDVHITAAPGKHGVYEITYVLQAGSASVYFAGDTMLIDELKELPARFGAVDVVLLPTNGLCVRPLNNLQVVMNAQDAAELTAVLQPKLVLPHHYAFSSGWLGDRILTKKDSDPTTYARLAAQWAPEVAVRIVEPGTRVTL